LFGSDPFYGVRHLLRRGYQCSRTQQLSVAIHRLCRFDAEHRILSNGDQKTDRMRLRPKPHL